MASFDEIVADALTTVRLVPRWQLDEADWAPVEAALAEMGTAVAARDARGVRRTLEELERHGPRRLAAIARESRTPPRAPPPLVLDLVNTLVHPSGGWERGPDGQAVSRSPDAGA